MATVAAIIGIGLTVAGTIKQSQAQQRAFETNQRIADRNQELARISASEARRKGEEDVGRVLIAGRQAIGAQRAAFAAQGIDVDVGVGSDVVLDTQRAIAQDVQSIRNNAALAAWGFENELGEFRLRSNLEELAARDRLTATAISGFTSAIGIGFDTGLFRSRRQPLGASPGAASGTPSTSDILGNSGSNVAGIA